MSLNKKIIEFTSHIEESLSNNTFVKLSLGNYRGIEENLKNVYIKKILIKGEEKLSFNFRYKTRDIFKNYTIAEGIGKINALLNDGFHTANLFSTVLDLNYENINNEKFIIRKNAPSNTTIPSLEHDKNKKRLIAPKGKQYLYELKITDKEGNVNTNSQDKYRQINHYIEILSSLIKDIPSNNINKIVDMGSGKGYLTFALYDYLSNVLKLKTQVTGVEQRPEIVELCNKIAKSNNFDNLNFVQSSIEKFDSRDTNILIALHACDTATDDAICKGITANADLIVVAPCCHKQIRREIEKHKAHNELDFLTKYGIFTERQAEMITDGIRALILEYFGYKTKVFEFISDAHTPKNVMIVGTKKQSSITKDERILQEIKKTKVYFGIEYHHLEKLMELL
ncbi:MAG: SAM-dependent methyltransferase [Bacteroidetes bacterium]|nr:SAM-dependent methyltransferase [Bacteroidota bacterium]